MLQKTYNIGANNNIEHLKNSLEEVLKCAREYEEKAERAVNDNEIREYKAKASGIRLAEIMIRQQMGV